MNRDNPSELFPVVDETGRVVGCATRGECHDGRRLLHPVVHLHLFNSRGELYLQKRPLWKDIQPGRWDTAVGGHVDYGETPRRSAAPRSTRGAWRHGVHARTAHAVHLRLGARARAGLRQPHRLRRPRHAERRDRRRTVLDDRRDPPHTGHGSLHAQFRERIPPRLPNGRRDRLNRRSSPR